MTISQNDNKIKLISGLNDKYLVDVSFHTFLFINIAFLLPFRHLTLLPKVVTSYLTYFTAIHRLD